MNENNNILIIEDEERIARMIELELTYEGYNVTKAYDGRSGLDMCTNGNFDLILLDVMLPSLSGMEVLRRIRSKSNIPVILLTARDSTIDKVNGLDLGANDYITKPFEIEELLARIRASLRIHSINNTNNTLTLGSISVNEDQRTVTVNEDNITLTKKEFDLLLYLMKNIGIVQTRDALLNNVWNYDYMGETNNVDVYISYLRSKIEEPYNIKLIHTVRGIGYVIRE